MRFDYIIKPKQVKIVTRVFCTGCGKSNPSNARFCISCGKPLPIVDKVECPKCNKLNSKNSMFCIYCGGKIGTHAQEWKEKDLKATGAEGMPQWKPDDLVFCPKCNYGCNKSWGTCPMCHTSLDGSEAVPLIIDDASSDAVIMHDDEDLKTRVKNELATVISNHSVIGMDELARLCRCNESKATSMVKDLIATGVIEGYIDQNTMEYISEISESTPIILDVKKTSEEKLTDLSAVITEEKDDSVNDMVKDLVQSLDLKRGFDFEGGRIHYKIALKNKSQLVIHDIKVYLDVPEFFKAEDEDLSQTIPSLSPDESRGLDFYLEPRECGSTEISATVLFKDIYGKRHAKLVPPLEISIKSPIVAPSKSSIQYIRDLTQRLASDMKMFALKDIDDELLYNAAFRAISKFDMSCVHDEKKEESMEAWFSAVSKVDKEPIITRVIVSTEENVLEIRVWCNDDKQLTGFLARVITSLRDEIELIRSIKSEDKKQALKLMALGRNIEMLKNYAGLSWQTGDINAVMLEIKNILEGALEKKDIDTIINEIDGWSEKLKDFKPDEHIPDEMADALYNDVERWSNLINLELGIVEGS